MLGLSLLLHIALIMFMPGFGIFLPIGDLPFIEIETIVLSPETEEEPGVEVESEPRESTQGEFSVQPTLRVSVPDRFESPDAIGEWERSILDREPQVLDIPRNEPVPDNRPPNDPKALTVHVELQREASKAVPESNDGFKRPEPLTADDVTKSAEQPFDLAALRGEEPLPEAALEFTAGAFPERPENQAFLQPIVLAKSSRAVPTYSVAAPLRAFQQQDDFVSDMPELQLPERSERLETEEDSPILDYEEPRITLPPRAEVLPESNDASDFQPRPLPELVTSGALTAISERPIPQSLLAEIRPAVESELSPPRRDFRQQVVERKPVEFAQSMSPSFPERDDSIVDTENIRDILPKRQEDVAGLPQVDRDPAFSFSAKDAAGNQLKPVMRRTASLSAARVKTEFSDEDFDRVRPELGVSLPQVGFSVNQALAFERPAVSARAEEFEIEAPPELRRPKAEATPTPAPIFSVRRPTTLKARDPSSGARPLSRIPSMSTREQRERTSVAEPRRVNPSLVTQKAGLLQIERGEVLPFEDEKSVVEQDDVLEEAVTDEFDRELVEFMIEGPAASREVVYKPSRLPELAIEMEVNIRLKFWVLPDGSIGEVIPLQRGDVNLERAAIQYLKSWRFTPVTDAREVWGVMPIRYTLQ